MVDLVYLEKLEKLESVFLNILYLKPEERLITPTVNHLSDIKNILNEIFDAKCTDIIYTKNTDNQFFGIRINPAIDAQKAMIILTTDERVKIEKYQIELDSKLFDIDLDSKELVALLIFEISSMVDSYEIIDNIRGLVDSYVTSQDDFIRIRNSVNYSQLIIFAFKDTLYKLSSSMFKEDPEELTLNKWIQALDLQEEIVSGQNKIATSVNGVGDTVRSPKTIILSWMLTMYKDMKTNSDSVRYTLTDAKNFTGSKLEKMEIDKTLTSIDRINVQSVIEAKDINEVFERKAMHSLNEVSLFKSLKQSGLRSIEDDLYEFAIRVKNCSTEEDAMYIVRGINTRLNILEDYLANTPNISEIETKKWTEVANKYRALRIELTKKKIWDKSSYNIWVDYNKLDELD